MPLKKEVKDAVIPKIEEYEGRVNHLYLDTVSRVTVGVGHLVLNRVAMGMIILYKNKTKNSLPTILATLAEKQNEYDSIAKQKKGYKSSWYKQHTTLVMQDTDINSQRDQHMDSFYKDLSNIYKKSKGYTADFDNLADKVQIALFDMIFNLGADKIVNTFTEFDKHIKAGAWSKAADASNRSQVSDERNKYVKDLLQSVAKEDAKK
ncbi:MAG: hypothetical protein HY080_14205 [Gammaproteobacteria bacterium]|nr:hypothetical protein [Gammaproteobacteria bacterium]